MKPTRDERTSAGELTEIRLELGRIKTLLIAVLVIVAMGAFLPEPILGLISLVVLLVAVGYVLLLPFDRLLKRRLSAYDQEIERKVLESVGADSGRGESRGPGA